MFFLRPFLYSIYLPLLSSSPITANTSSCKAYIRCVCTCLSSYLQYINTLYLPTVSMKREPTSKLDIAPIASPPPWDTECKFDKCSYKTTHGMIAFPASASAKVRKDSSLGSRPPRLERHPSRLVTIDSPSPSRGALTTVSPEARRGRRWCGDGGGEREFGQTVAALHEKDERIYVCLWACRRLWSLEVGSCCGWTACGYFEREEWIYQQVCVTYRLPSRVVKGEYKKEDMSKQVGLTHSLPCTSKIG